VHARQRLRVHRPVRAGEQIVTLLFCDRAEVRNKRRWVYMRAQACGADGAPLCDGEMLMLWAR
jgi:acyl dehydratase